MNQEQKLNIRRQLSKLKNLHLQAAQALHDMQVNITMERKSATQHSTDRYISYGKKIEKTLEEITLLKKVVEPEHIC